MPNRDVHVPVGKAVGTLTAGYLAKDENWHLVLIRAPGGYIGGKLGALMPDIIDPSSNGPISLIGGVFQCLHGSAILPSG